jgi:endonuclease YncB( thermonuclease family)
MSPASLMAIRGGGTVVKYLLACVYAVEIDDVRGIKARDELRRLLGRSVSHVRDIGIKDGYHRPIAIIAVGITTAGCILVSQRLAEQKDSRDTKNWCRRL